MLITNICNSLICHEIIHLFLIKGFVKFEIIYSQFCAETWKKSSKKILIIERRPVTESAVSGQLVFCTTATLHEITQRPCSQHRGSLQRVADADPHLSLGSEQHNKQGGYDFAFLQDQSQNPANYGRDATASILTGLTTLADKVRAASPSCKVILEETWSLSSVLRRIWICNLENL